ncbi:RDD family protein [Streptomyces sp. NPDC006610]|uniref:RDD family protein n=1 Tax=Streptomyces sp. NPDC006610 TaxID=3154584 RepID=UPI0033A5FB93
MSAPTPAPGDDRPREGYYPDPSIPGYVRYWNGANWVPGTSRPAPSEGEVLAPPSTAPVEETGPHFFDEAGPADARHGSRPEPAAAWGADRLHQSGFGGDQDRRVAWGAPQGTDPRVPAGQDGGNGSAGGAGHGSSAAGATGPGAAHASDGSAGPVRPDGAGAADEAAAGRFGDAGDARPGGGSAGSATPAWPSPAEATGPVTQASPTALAGSAGAGASAGSAEAARPGPSGHLAGQAGDGRVSGASGPSGTGAAAWPGGPAPSVTGTGPSPAPAWPASSPEAPAASAAHTAAGDGSGPGGGDVDSGSTFVFRRPKGGAPAADTAAEEDRGTMTFRAVSPRGGQHTPRSAPSGVPRQAPAPATPVTTGPGGGQASWPQQVHRLPGDEQQPVAPWKPPVEDVFQAAARRQASARPAGLGRRLAARLIDSLVVVAVTSAAAVPLGAQAADHIQGKIDEAKLSGRTVTVWLLDGTTSVYFGAVLAVLLLTGVLYEALPTAKWGRTLGKRLLGLEVRDIEAHEPPSFGAALRRWLVYSVPGLLGLGLIGVAWCLFDKPWRQCWHDKAAHTFVAG